nr:hypothetical protein [Clostridioides sp.]
MLVLDLPKGTTIDDQLGKVAEEFAEFVNAVIYEDSNEEVLSEFYDVVQAMIGVLDLKGIDKDTIESGALTHIAKLGERGWNIKGTVNL